MNGTKEYWLAVGSVSEKARKQLEEADCIVQQANTVPPVVLVCLRYRSDEGSNDLKIWDHGEMHIHSKNLRLHHEGLHGNVINAKITSLADKHTHSDAHVSGWHDHLAEPDDDPY